MASTNYSWEVGHTLLSLSLLLLKCKAAITDILLVTMYQMTVRQGHSCDEPEYVFSFLAPNFTVLVHSHHSHSVSVISHSKQTVKDSENERDESSYPQWKLHLCV